MNPTDFLQSEVRVTRHADGDDLLSAGLGLAGLRAPAAPTPADPAAPTPAELRRRAFHTNWRGIANLADPAHAELAPVPGREYSAFARVAGASQPHRVLAQVPDAFDSGKRCLVVAAASGSRGVYGAIAAAGPWALPRGCALVHTDKGNGTGLFDFDSDTGVALDGTRAVRGSAPLEFAPLAGAGEHRVALKHAHSGDNPEADWGRHVLQAAAFGLHALDLAFPAQAPFTPENTRILAVGVSNGGGAVLHAGELPDALRWFDAVVAGEPNITPPGARPLYDVATQAALYQPCALLALPDAPAILPEAAWRAAAEMRCASLRAAGLLDGDTPEAQGADALARLRADDWTDGALQLAGLNLAFDLWRAVAATYVQAYARARPDAALCGYAFAATTPTGSPRASTAAERALWWSDASGVAPTAGVTILDSLAAGTDSVLPGLRCARDAWTGDDQLARAVRAGVEAVRATARPRAALTLVVHGQDDGLVPIAFTSRPYAAIARDASTGFRFWELPHAQHFDAFVGVPALRARYVPLIPHLHRALDHAWAAIVEGTPPPASGVDGVPER